MEKKVYKLLSEAVGETSNTELADAIQNIIDSFRG